MCPLLTCVCHTCHALSQLGNIAGDGRDTRDAVLRVGTVPALLGLLSSEPCRVSLMRNATWAVSNCVRGGPSWEAVERTLPVLKGVIAKETDVEVLTDAVRTIIAHHENTCGALSCRCTHWSSGRSVCCFCLAVLGSVLPL